MGATRALAWLAALAAAGCGSSSSTDGADKKKAPPSGPIEKFEHYMEASKQTEAQLNLHGLGKSARTGYIERAEFPKGKVGPTPAAGACCEHPSRKCQPDPAQWHGSLWDELDFEVGEPALFSYEYESDGITATVRAIGDLDCDKTLAVWEVKCRAVAGNPSCDPAAQTSPD